MYRGLVVSGAILGIFGVFLVFTDLYVPIGVSVFGLPITVAGNIMFLLGFLRGEPMPVETSPSLKFCWYCTEKIPEDLAECPSCSLPQHDRLGEYLLDNTAPTWKRVNVFLSLWRHTAVEIAFRSIVAAVACGRVPPLSSGSGLLTHSPSSNINHTPPVKASIEHSSGHK